VSVNVYVACFDAIFHNLSLTYQVLVIETNACCHDTHVLVTVHRLLPLKLYGVVCNHTPVSIAPVIINIQSTHSGHEPLENVNVGGVVSLKT
jgi:hypothetical protein